GRGRIDVLALVRRLADRAPVDQHLGARRCRRDLDHARRATGCGRRCRGGGLGGRGRGFRGGRGCSRGGGGRGLRGCRFFLGLAARRQRALVASGAPLLSCLSRGGLLRRRRRGGGLGGGRRRGRL